MTTLLIQGARAWLGPGRRLDDPAIVLEGSRILWIGPAGQAGPADEELEGDWFLMPGAVDHHVHLGLSDPKAVLRAGVTAVRDLGWPPEEVFPLVDISTGTDFDGPAVAAAGPMFTCRDGYPARASWAPEGTALEVEGPADAVAAVLRLADSDPAIIKVALNAEAGPTLSDPELLAIVEAAHGRGLAVTAHLQGPGQTERAVGAGVDELAHTPWTERLPDGLVQAMARSVAMVSTLDIHSFGRSTPQLETAVDNLRRFRDAGGRVRYGTDLGNGPIPPGIHAGEARHLAAAGLPADEILGSMTHHGIEPGAPADLVGLQGDPTEDLGALSAPGLVIRGGRLRHLER